MSGAKIIIVEDEGIQALDLQQRLTNLGYTVADIVSTGEEAIKRSGEILPDLVLMDIMLRGDIDGIVASERIQALYDTPIIYITAYADEETLQRAKITEPYGYIVKPIRERELHIIIDMALYKHRMQRELKESRDWLATTLRSIGDAVVATDKNGSVTFMNPIAEKLMGWKLEEASNRKLSDIFNIINMNTRKRVENPVERVLREGLIAGLANHTVLIARDGKEIPIDDSAAPIKADRGDILGVILVFRDITERRRAEEALYQAKLEWERTFDTIPDLIAIIDTQHQIVQVNQAMAHQLGATPQQCVGLKCFECVHGTNQPPEFCPHTKTLQDGQEHVAEVHEERLNGDFLVSTTPLRDEEGKIVSSVHVARNITERKKAEEALQESEERFRIIAEMSPIQISVSSTSDGTILFTNPAYEQTFGFAKGELIGKKAPDLYYNPADRRVLVDTLKKEGSVRNYEVRVKRKDGTPFWVVASVAPIHFGGKEAFLGASIDITDRKRLEAKNEEYAKHLEELVEERTKQLRDSERLAAIGATAGMVGHDLRNPLQTIEGALFLANEEMKPLPDSPEKKSLQEICDIVSEQVTYMDKIVSDLQDFVKPIKPQVEEADIQRIIHGALSTIALPENITVNTLLEEDAQRVVVDPVLMMRVFNNLITNAVQAMPTGGKLTLKTRWEGTTMVLTVSDTGVGIPEDVKPKLFQPLFTTKSRGQGFGLSVCKRIVEAHSGSITFESEVGKGTTFTIQLPNQSRL